MNRSKPQRHRRRRVDTVVGMGPEPEAEPTAEETDSAASQASEAQPDEARSEAAAVEVIRPDPQAKTFGDEGKAWLNVQISKDKLQATLTAISYGGAKVRGQEIVTALTEKYNIAHGLNADVIKAVAAKARKEKVVRGEFIIAKGSPAEPGEDGKIELTFFADSEQRTLPFRELMELLGKEGSEVDAIVESDLFGILVTPGELLATIVPPTEGTPSFDVLGNHVLQPGAPAKGWKRAPWAWWPTATAMSASWTGRSPCCRPSG